VISEFGFAGLMDLLDCGGEVMQSRRKTCQCLYDLTVSVMEVRTGFICKNRDQSENENVNKSEQDFKD